MTFGCFNIKCFLIFGAVFCCAKISLSQQADTSLVNMEYIGNLNIWLQGSNAAGLNYTPVDKISTARVFFEKSNGTFKNYFQSDNSLNIGAETESFYKLNKNVFLYGKLVYENFKGKNMQGSALINPYSNPLGFEENTDTLSGTKKLESYSLTGALSAKVAPRFILGGNVDYNVADYAKVRDLRHVNNLLNMNVSVGLAYLVSKRLDLGLSYSYTRRIEGLKFEIDGNTDRQYLVFINYGNFYGRNELFGESGYTKEKRPIVNNTNKVALQLNYNINSMVSVFNEFTVSGRKGYFGNKGTASVIFTDHNATQYAYSGVVKVKRQSNLHLIKLKGSFEQLESMENLYNKTTTPGRPDLIVYFGQNKLLDQQIATANLGYTGYFKVNALNPLWIINAWMALTYRYQKSAVFPFYRKQDLNSYVVHSSISRNFFVNRNVFSFSLGLGYGAGSGKMNEDGLYQAPSESQNTPASRNSYLQQEFAFLTQSRLQIDPALQYTRSIKYGKAIYIKGAAYFTKASNSQFLGNSYQTGSVSVGCFF